MYKAQKVQKYALNSHLQALQILKNDDEVENWSLFSFFLAVSKIGMYIFSNNTSWKYWRIFLKTYLLLTPIKALTPFNLVLTLPCPTMKVMSKKLGTSSLLSLGYWKALVKSLASWSCPSKRSRTESKSGLEGLIWPMGRQEPRLKKEKEFFRQPIENCLLHRYFLKITCRVLEFDQFQHDFVNLQLNLLTSDFVFVLAYEQILVLNRMHVHH